MYSTSSSLTLGRLSVSKKSHRAGGEGVWWVGSVLHLNNALFRQKHFVQKLSRIAHMISFKLALVPLNFFSASKLHILNIYVVQLFIRFRLKIKKKKKIWILTESRYFSITPHLPCQLGYWIHRLHLCRGIKTLRPTSVLNITLNNLMVQIQLWSFAPRFTLTRSGTIYQPLRSGRIWHKVNF